MIVEEVVPPVEEPAVEAAPEIIALDEGGAVLPLASEEAAERWLAATRISRMGRFTGVARWWRLCCDCSTGKCTPSQCQCS